MEQGEDIPRGSFGDHTGDHSGGGRWLTYDELGRTRGIGRESAVKLVQRKRWRRIPGNDGVARVYVPLDWLTRAREPSPDHSPHVTLEPSQDADGIHLALAALREAHAGEIERLAGAKDSEITRLTDALARAEGWADTERARADLLLHQSDGLRDRLMVVEAKLAVSQGATQDAKERLQTANERLQATTNRLNETTERLSGLDNLLADAERRLNEAEDGRRTAQERLDAQDRAEVVRRGRGRWARLRAAWRGE